MSNRIHRVWTNETSTLLVQMWTYPDHQMVTRAERDNPGHAWGPPVKLPELPAWVDKDLILKSGPPLVQEDPHAEAIGAGMLEWESGSLTRAQLHKVLADALADLWADTYRTGRSVNDRQREFAERLQARVDEAGAGVTVR